MLIILVGPSGSGKSTYAKNFSDFVVCSADTYMHEDGQYKFSVEKLGMAHGKCQRAARFNLITGNNVLIDNTNTRARERKEYLKMAEELGVEVEIHCLPWKKEFLSRNIHGVEPTGVQKQVDRVDLEFGWVYDRDGNKLREIQ